MRGRGTDLTYEIRPFQEINKISKHLWFTDLITDPVSFTKYL